MTALRKPTPTLDLGRRGREDVFTPRPCAGDHKALVGAAMQDTKDRHGETLKELAKV